jgi:RNA polymerase sigma-70 factor (ECF subfamily)
MPLDTDSVPASARQFATTRWSAVLAAGRRTSPDAARALDQLCRIYWFPLYAWVRRQGHPPHDAQDLIQGFFARLLEKDDLAAVDPARGKFRSFLLAALKHYVANEQDRVHAWKRGGRHEFVPFETDAAESRYGAEPADNLSADRIYDRRWALTVLEQVMARLRAEFRSRGRETLFDQLKSCLTGERLDQPYADLARSIGVSESAVKVAVHRLRQRYRELLRDEIVQTLGDANAVEEELRHLMDALRCG